MPDNNPSAVVTDGQAGSSQQQAPPVRAAPGHEASSLPFRLELPQPFQGDGSESFLTWIQRFEVALNVAPFHHDKYRLLAAKLAGPAFSYWQSLPDTVKTDYEESKRSLSAVFGRTQYLAAFQTYINARPRKHNEPLEVYAAELHCLVKESFPSYGNEAQKCELFRRFVAGLDPSLQLKIHEHGATTIDAALKIATQCERAQLAMTVTSPTPLMSIAASPLTGPLPDILVKNANMDQKVPKFCKIF